MLDRVAFPRSVGTYAGHNGSVTDAVAIENSHRYFHRYSCGSIDNEQSLDLWLVYVTASLPVRRTARCTCGASTCSSLVQVLLMHKPSLERLLDVGVGFSHRNASCTVLWGSSICIVSCFCF